MATLHEAVVLAVRHHEDGRPDQAAHLLARVLAVRPDHFDALHLLGVLAGAGGIPARAITLIRRALAVAPGNEAAHLNLAVAQAQHGTVLQADGDADAAMAARRAAVALCPDWAEAWATLSAGFGDQGRHIDAVRAGRLAVRLRPDLPEAWSNTAAALNATDRPEEADPAGRRAVALSPGQAGPWNNLALAHFRQGRPAIAAACWRRAGAAQPGNALIRWNHAFALLLAGELEAGWREYEWRFHAFPERARQYGPPRWEGEDLRDRTILLGHEQGFGDLIQFVRFAALLKERGARTVVECPRALLRLLRDVPGVNSWTVEGEPPPPCGVHLPLLSVPGRLGITLDGIPAPVPYLRPEPDRVEVWRRRVAGPPGLRVGVVWQGSAGGGRSFPLRCLAPLARVPGVRLISLQKHDGLEQLADLPAGMHVETLGEGFDAGPDAFVDTLAVMASLDLVISADTAAGHVAGAAGRPVWTMLGALPDWRWFLGRTDTPWYPTMRLFRQPRSGDWGTPAAAMAAALADLAWTTKGAGC